MKNHYKTLILGVILFLPGILYAQEELATSTVSTTENATTTTDQVNDENTVATTTDTTLIEEEDPSERIESLREDILNRRSEFLSNFRADTTEVNETQTFDERERLNEEFQNRAQEVRQNAVQVENEARQLPVPNDSDLYSRLTNFSLTLERRYTAAFDRLQRIRDLIVSRMQKIEDRGIDVATAEALLLEADTSLASLDARLASAIALIQELPTTDNPREHLDLIRVSVANLKESMKQAHTDLQAVVDELKVIVRAHAQARSGDEGRDETATTTQ